MTLPLRALSHEYAYDWRLADCEGCSLRTERDQTFCQSKRPAEFNGLMLLGEGPGGTEARLKEPFIGPAGKLLDTLLEGAGLKREHCYIGNVTGCQPPYGSKEQGLAQDHPSAILGCRPRLLTEIAHAAPRVIVAFGQAALASLTGTEQEHMKRTPNPCSVCSDARRWKKWGCSKCKELSALHPVLDPKDKPSDATPCCNAKWQPRWDVCTACEGKKTKVETRKVFLSEHRISAVAGGVFRAQKLELGKYLTDPASVFLVPTYHPAHIIRKAETKSGKQIGGQFLASAVLEHLKKAKRLLEEDPKWEVSWHEEQSPERIASFLAPEDSYAVDIETDALESEEVCSIKCVAFAPFRREATLVVHTEGLPSDHPKIQTLLTFFQDSSRTKVFQHGLYDRRVIKRLWQVEVLGCDEDTLVAHNCLSPDEPHDLQHIGFLYTDAEPWKPPKKHKGELVFGSKEELWEYNARDTRVTAESMKGLRVELERKRIRQVHDLDMRKCILALSMQEHGMGVDRQEMLRLGAEAQYEMETSLHKMREMVGRIPDRVAPKNRDEAEGKDPFAFNPSSNRQLGWALFDPQGPFKLEATSFSQKTQAPSTSEVALRGYAEHPFVMFLNEYRKAQTTKSVRIDGMPLGSDMRLHAYWNPVGARTGRWSSSPNFQNWPKWIRSMVVAPKGRVFVGADFSQLEMRILAAVSGDAELIRRCIHAIESRKLEPEHDPHSYVASISLGSTFTSLALNDPKHDKADKRCGCETCTRKLFRDITKRTFYGIGYGGGAETIRDAIYDGGYEGPPISIAMVQQTVQAIGRAFPGVRDYQQNEIATAEKSGYVKDALLGRYRVFPLRQVDFTVASNFRIQSSAATLMDVAAWNLHCTLQTVDPTAFIFALVHDAVYVECAKDKAPEVAKLVESCMNCEIVIHKDAQPMPIPATAAIANNWKDAA